MKYLKILKNTIFEYSKGTYLIADKEIHDWSGIENVGLPTVIVWSVVLPLINWWFSK